MIKKLLFSALLIATACLTMAAQQLNGRWTLYPIISDGFRQVIETSERVYTLTGNTLSHYTFGDNERYDHNMSNTLSEGGKISAVYYNYAKKYLLVAYESGNIDLIYDNGRTVNLPEIRDAVLSTEHTINDVTFHDGKIYVATAFGYVIFDDERHEVSESAILNTNIEHAFHLCGNLVLLKYPEVYVAADGTRRASLDHFTKLDESKRLWYKDGAVQMGDNTVVFRDTGNGLTGREYKPVLTDGHTSHYYHGASSTGDPLTSTVIPTANGAFAYTAKRYVSVNSDHTVDVYMIPSSLSGGVAHTANTLASVWIEKDGELGRYDLTGETPRKLMTIAMPNGTHVDDPVLLKWNKDYTRLYVGNITANFVYTDPGDNMGYPCYIDALDGDTFIDMAAKDAKRYASKYKDYRYDAATGRLAGCTNFAVDPDDDDIVYISSNNFGVAMVKDNDVLGITNKYNNPTPEYWWLNRTMNVDIDNSGNLWMFIGYAGEAGQPCIAILPAAKRRQLETGTPADWVSIDHSAIFNDDNAFQRDVRSLFCKKSDMIFYTAGAREGGWGAYHENGTPLRPADDKSAYYHTVTDTEGNSLLQIYNYDMVEDQNGAVWFGTDRGVFYIANPADALNPATLRVKRPIVPRNDGTNFGDYLLETESVYCIAVDPSNRKWLGTISSGLYLVSADGTRIIAHYTTENSPLPSNSVYAVTCDPNSNRVYVGTRNGFAAFDSDSAPGADDYSDVYAYPNPVRPDYTGWITVKGLMDNSLVKIADAAGNVFFTGRSEGGMISWDGCDASGRRVKTGVYFVFASQNASGSSSGVVTKIMVVN